VSGRPKAEALGYQPGPISDARAKAKTTAKAKANMEILAAPE
jgi:hypothetical protein